MKREFSSAVEESLKKNKVVLLIGQRQVGKTYELQRFFKNKSVQHFDFEDHSFQELFSTVSINRLKKILPDKTDEHYLLLDEIQYLENSGSILKLLHDHFPHVKIVATGSASFLLLKNIGDSLFGRVDIYTVLPLTIREILQQTDKKFHLKEYDDITQKGKIEEIATDIMRYGSFPAVFLENSEKEKKKLLKNYVSSMLFKDIFEIEGIRNPTVFKKLIFLLALQIGSEVNTTELSKTLGVSKPTIEEYIGLYEKFQIIYQVASFATNPKKEISKGKKIYFVDLGLRNALIENFLPAEQRTDKGALFENFVFNLFRGHMLYFQEDWKLHFWRSYQKSEVDLVISQNGGAELFPIEIKWKKFTLPPRSFTGDYESKLLSTDGITFDTLWEWV